MPNETRQRLLNEISNLSTDDVVALLRKNKLSECCDAIVKRQVDGEGLLHLSEGNLNLWKRDLTISLRRSLCRFVAELNNNPKQYFQEEDRLTSPSPDQSDDDSGGSESWDTDFEDDEPSRSTGEDSADFNDSSAMYRNGNSRPQSRTSPGIPANEVSRLSQEVEVNDNLYSNGATYPIASNVPHNMVSQLRERLQLQIERRKPPTLGPKPKLVEKSPQVIELVRNTQALQQQQRLPRPETNPAKPTPSPESIKNINAPKIRQSTKYLLPPNPINTSRILPTPDEKPRELPKPPSDPPRLGNLDLVADLPPDKVEDSDEYDYEPIKGQPTEQQYQGSGSMKSAHSTQSLVSARSIRGSSESVHHPQNTADVEDNQEVYEVISDSNNRVSYMQPIASPFTSKTQPWTLPSRPSPANSLPTARRQASLSECLTKAALTQARENLAKRPEPRPYGTHPNVSQSSRPLPPTPIGDLKFERQPPEINYDVPSYTKKPWFHNIGREEAIALIEGGSSKFSTTPPDGYFLLRPSTANAGQPWTLVLWYKNKTYNIPVRTRFDAKYALGTAKPKELSFTTIEELVDFYKKNELVLNSSGGDSHVGKTRLTETPPRTKD